MSRIVSDRISFLLFSVFLTLIFIRPFISETAYPALGGYIQIGILLITLLWLLTVKNPRIATTLFSKVLFFYMLSASISLFYSINLRSSIYQIYQLTPLLCIFIFTVNLEKKQTIKLITTMIVSVLILSIYGIYQYIWGFEHTKEYISLNLKDMLETRYVQEILLTRRAIATFFSPNMFASYLSMTAPLCAGLLLDSIKNKKTFVFLTACLIFIFTSLVLTKSIAGWLSLSFGIIIFFILTRGIGRKITLMSAIFITIIAAILLLSRYNMFFNLANQQNTILQRLSFFKGTFEIIKDFPIKGVGVGNLGNIYLKYKGFIGNETRFSHNLFLQTWAETGLLGLISVILLTLTFLWSPLKMKKNFTNIGIISSGYVFIVNNLFDFSYFIPQVSFVWWAVMGLMFQQITPLWQKQGNKMKIFFALAIIFIIFMNVRSLIALAYFRKGDYRKAVSVEPYNDLYYAAMKDYATAIKLNPYFPFYHRDLALLYLREGMPEKAINELEKASELYPASARLHQLLLELYEKAGKTEKAKKEKAKLEEFYSEYSGYFIR